VNKIVQSFTIDETNSKYIKRFADLNNMSMSAAVNFILSLHRRATVSKISYMGMQNDHQAISCKR